MGRARPRPYRGHGYDMPRSRYTLGPEMVLKYGDYLPRRLMPDGTIVPGVSVECYGLLAKASGPARCPAARGYARRLRARARRR